MRKMLLRCLTVASATIAFVVLALNFGSANAQSSQPMIHHTAIVCQSKTQTVYHILIQRAAGLDQETSILIADYDIQILRFYAKEAGNEFVESGVQEMYDTIERVYNLDEETITNADKRREWSLEYYDECISIAEE